MLLSVCTTLAIQNLHFLKFSKNSSPKYLTIWSVNSILDNMRENSLKSLVADR